MKKLLPGILILMTIHGPIKAADQGNTFHLVPPYRSVKHSKKVAEHRKQVALKWYQEHLR